MAVEITLKDTGKRSVGSGDVETKANSGNALTLHAEEVSYSLEALTGSNPSLMKTESNLATNMFDYSVLDRVGVGVPAWVIRGRFFDDTGSDIIKSGTANTLSHFGVLNSMVRTKGYKEMVSDLGKHSDEGGTTTTVNCHIKSLQVIHNFGAGTTITYVLTLEETR